jgi:hypothetical protein
MFDPIIYFFPTAIGLQDFQDHEPYLPIVDLSDFQSHPPRKKQKSIEGKVTKKSYDNTRKFQTKWATKMPWASIVS